MTTPTDPPHPPSYPLPLPRGRGDADEKKHNATQMTR